MQRPVPGGTEVHCAPLNEPPAVHVLPGEDPETPAHTQVTLGGATACIRDHMQWTTVRHQNQLLN